MAEKRTGSSSGSMHIPGLREALTNRTAATPNFRPPFGADPDPPTGDRYGPCEPIYFTRMWLFRSEVSVPDGDMREWLVVDADDNVRIAPTAHLSEGARRCNTYYPPPAEGEADRG